MTAQAVSTGEKHEYEGRSYDDWARSGLCHTQQERCVVSRIALLWGVFVTSRAAQRLDAFSLTEVMKAGGPAVYAGSAFQETFPGSGLASERQRNRR